MTLAISVAALLNGWLLFRGLRREGVVTFTSGWGWLLARLAAANALMTACLLWLGRPLEWWLGQGSLERWLWLAAIIGIAAAVYFLALIFMGVRPGTLRLKQD